MPPIGITLTGCFFVFVDKSSPLGHQSFWIGGSDRDEEGVWIWKNSTEPITLDFWASDRPDNYAGIQHCLTYRYFTDEFLWDDRPCDENNTFVCNV